MRPNNSFFYANFEKKAIYCIVITLSIFYFLPYILFGSNSIVTVHDNLDCFIPYYRMYSENGLFLKFDAPTKGFSEMSTLYYGHVNFTITPLLFNFFNTFVAYSINYCLSILLGFFSMYILLRKIGFIINPTISILVSACYAILPVDPNLSFAVNSLPLIIVVFFHFASQSKFSWKIMLILFYPIISTFTMTGIFILGCWIIGAIVLWIKNKQFNLNLFVGFLLLCIGYILTDLRLFYVMFVLKTPLNRSVFTVLPDEIMMQIKTFLHSLVHYIATGYYHAASFQLIIIIPIVFLVFLFVLITLIHIMQKQQGTLFSKIKIALDKTVNPVKLFLLLTFSIFIIYFIAALYDSGLLNYFIAKYIPLLKGFDWGRVWFFNRILWYVVFALSLQFIWEIKTTVLKINIGGSQKKLKIPPFLPRLSVWLFVFLQLGYIMLTPVEYNDPVKTWVNELAIKTGIAKKMMPGKNIEAFVSYKEFFAEELFDKIKKDISYTDERVVAFGYHPSVLMYNGFNCIDGYNNSYPLSYMKRFRALIEPELEINQFAREYYDSWGGRMYLYNTEFDFNPTRNKVITPIKLNIDMNVFKNDFGGKYIVSSMAISNSDSLDLKLIKKYDSKKSIYAIYLYTIN